MKYSAISYFDRDTLLHLRLPFSFFLLPVFCFGISQASSINTWNTVVVFVVLHLFIYPGSNIYNSYMDDDKGSIGGLKNPPPVTKKLYYVSILFDIIGLLLCLLVGLKLLLLMVIYIAVSKAYSWKGVRLKKYAYLGWLVVMLFQGGYTFLLVNMCCENNFTFDWFNVKNNMCMMLASLLIGASYPLTQIYQHDEDSSRGDFTISYRLGIKGTFIFTGVLFFIACIIAYNYFHTYYSTNQFEIFIFSLSPVMIYFVYWFLKVLKSTENANYDNTMRMTMVSSCCMIACFLLLTFLNHF